MTSSSLQSKIAAFEQAAADAEDPKVMANKISEKSDRKKYAFAAALSNDLQRTRAALTTLAGNTGKCTFSNLYKYTEGRIANLNQVLKNLKRAQEIDFEPECFFKGIHDDETIVLLEQFWNETYSVDEENVFRTKAILVDVDERDRKGRSYEAEDAETRHTLHCFACSKQVRVEERITVRAHVFHLSCLSCAVCGASPRQKKDYVTFDGRICCSSACIALYDGAHVRQERIDNLETTGAAPTP